MYDNNSTNEYNEELSLINKWIRHRLSDGAASFVKQNPQMAEVDTSDLLTKFVKSKIVDLKRLLDCGECLLVSVRSEFREVQDYLRPVYSFPIALNQHLQDPEYQKPFSFEYDVIKEVPFSGIHVHPSAAQECPNSFVALHKVENYTSQQAHGKDALNPEKCFAPRIDKFWQDLKNAQDPMVAGIHKNIDKLENSTGLFCFFAGESSDVNRSNLSLKHIVALYFIADKDLVDNLDAKTLEQAQNITSILFSGIELIERIDSALFELEGLQLVAELLPEFSDQSLATADKIAIALARFGKLVKRHIIGRTAEESAPNIFYMSCSFEQSTDERFVPRLYMYPNIYRFEYPMSSVQISHRNLPSASKFLLHQYLTSSQHQIVFGRKEGQRRKWNNANISTEFSDLFSSQNLKTAPVSEWLDTVWNNAEPDILHMVEYDKRWKGKADGYCTPWEALNKPATPNDCNRSIVAIVVESEILPGKDTGIQEKAFPRGILAIESKSVAAFSDNDIRALRKVLGGLASLIRQITHRNSSIDYRPQLARAFNHFSPGDTHGNISETNKARLVFLAQTLDGKRLHLLLDAFRDLLQKDEKLFFEHISNSYLLTKEGFTLVDKISAKFERIDDEELSEEAANELIVTRLKSMQEFLKTTKEKHSLDEALDFLEACTENFLWSSFLSSFGEALGDRINHVLPTFRFMRPGYSASRMFMAIVDEELKQVVKLSSRTKLEKELNRYMDFVRYRVVNAARIPVNAFAFDTIGKEGFDRESDREKNETKYREPFGALVSDLVFGIDPKANQVNTLVSKIVEELKRIANKPASSRPKTIGPAQGKLEDLFKKHLQLWRSPKTAPENETSRSVARNAFRLPENATFPSKKEFSSQEPLDAEDKYDLNEASDTTLIKRKKDLLLTCDEFNNYAQAAGLEEDAIKKLWLSDDLLEYALQEDELSKLSSITHGDMNARNLTWAGGLDSFFLIDFEHVGYGVDGTDQIRLVVNITTELFGAYLETTKIGRNPDMQRSRELSFVLSEIDLAMDILSVCIRTLLDGDQRSLKDILAQTGKSLLPEEKKIGQLWRLLEAVLGTLPPPLTNSGDARTRHNVFWGYCLFCSCLKEFEYSRRSVKQDDLESIVLKANRAKFSADNKTSEELLNFLLGSIGTNNINRSEMLGRAFRYFVSAKLLFKVLSDE